MLKVKNSRQMIEELFDSLSWKIKNKKFRTSKEKKKFDLQYEILGFEIENYEISLEMLQGRDYKPQKAHLHQNLENIKKRFAKLSQTKQKIDEMSQSQKSSKGSSQSKVFIEIRKK